MTEIADRYDPAGVESRWYREWESRGLFHADAESSKPPYCIMIPPPNVTGSLHMGHAFTFTLQDILIRYKRMDGYNALWLPGTDHAGIATQNVVERQLAGEGKTKEDLGREAFIARVWKWKEESGGAIINQLKRLGASFDWQRERFTMDEGLSRAVREVFVRLWEEGLVYQGDYIVNWCPRCQTALSDLEVEREERDEEFVYIRYGPLTLGTVRPETKLGDTGVAVHPRDKRYAKYIGKTLEIQSVDGTIEIRVVADASSRLTQDSVMVGATYRIVGVAGQHLPGRLQNGFVGVGAGLVSSHDPNGAERTFADGEVETYLGFASRLGDDRSHLSLAVAGHGAVEGEGHGIENRGLTGPGRTGEGKQIGTLEINDGAVEEGAETD